MIRALALAAALFADGCTFGTPTPAPLPTASVASPPPVSDGATCFAECSSARLHCPAMAADLTTAFCEEACKSGARNLMNSAHCIAWALMCSEPCK